MVCTFNRKEKIKINDAELKVKIIAEHGIGIDEIKNISSFVGDSGGDSLKICTVRVRIQGSPPTCSYSLMARTLTWYVRDRSSILR